MEREVAASRARPAAPEPPPVQEAPASQPVAAVEEVEEVEEPPPPLVEAPPVASDAPAAAAAEAEAARELPAEGRWNLEELAALVERRADEFPDRADEWRAYIVYLRDFVGPDSLLPTSFAGLIDDVFGMLIEEPQRA